MKKTTRKMLNLNSMTDYSVKGYDNADYIFYIVQPFNTSVMDPYALKQKIIQASTVIKQTLELDFWVQNGRENFEKNKDYIKRRLEEETEPAVRKLLELDLRSYDEMQVSTATNRTFIMAMTLRHLKESEIIAILNRTERTLQQNGFIGHKMSREEIKVMLAVYLNQNVTTEYFEDISGERWLDV